MSRESVNERVMNRYLKRDPENEKYFLNGEYAPIGWSLRDVLEVFYPEECRIENDDKLIEAAKKFAEVLKKRNYLNGVRFHNER